MAKGKIKKYIPKGPENLFSYFVGANPPTSFNPVSKYPKIHKSVFLGPFSSIIGDVTVCEDVFIAPNVSIRADEGTPFYIGAKSNIQDGVVLHGLKNTELIAYGKNFSIYIGSEVSIAHKAIVHGPCIIGDNTFIGFNSIVFNAIIEENCYIDMSTVISGGIRINAGSYVPVGSVVDTQKKADCLPKIPKNKTEFAQKVVDVNNELSEIYSLKFGEVRCSCGFCCNSDNLLKGEIKDK